VRKNAMLLLHLLIGCW